MEVFRFCPEAARSGSREIPRAASVFFQEVCEPSGHAHGALLALRGQQVIGVLRYRYRGELTLVSKGVWVLPEQRGKGVGTRMLAHLMRETGRTTFLGYSVTPAGEGWLKAQKKLARVLDGNPDAKP